MESAMHPQRTTTGQSLTISYDAATNTMVFRELDRFAAPVRSNVALGKAVALRLISARTRRAPMGKRPDGRAA
jgi:hypothetical protein